MNALDLADDGVNEPFSQDCDDAFNCHQHRKSSKVFQICILFLCMYIYNIYVHILYYITFASNYTEIFYANARVFLMQRLGEMLIWHRLLFWLPLSVILKF